MADLQHKLTPAEIARAAKIDALRERLAERGFAQRDLTTTIAKASTTGLVMALALCVPFVIAYLLLGRAASSQFSLGGDLIAFAALLVSIPVHEGIHGLFFGLFAPAGFASVEYGFIREALTPYATCTEPIRRWQYMIAILAPTVALGVVPMTLACVLGGRELLIFGVLSALGGAGDVLVALKLATYHPTPDTTETLFLDHPTEVGLMAFERSAR